MSTDIEFKVRDNFPQYQTGDIVLYKLGYHEIKVGIIKDCQTIPKSIEDIAKEKEFIIKTRSRGCCGGKVRYINSNRIYYNLDDTKIMDGNIIGVGIDRINEFIKDKEQKIESLLDKEYKLKEFIEDRY